MINSKYLYLVVSVIFFGLLFPSGGAVVSQTPPPVPPTSSEFWINLRNDDPGPFTWYMMFGNHVNASYDLDTVTPVIIEKEGPPMSPGFDVRWIPIPGRPNPAYGVGLLRYNFREITGDPAQCDTFVLLFQNPSSPASDVILRWPDEVFLSTQCDSMFIMVPPGFDGDGNIVQPKQTINAFLQDSLVLVSPLALNISRVTIYKYGIKNPAETDLPPRVITYRPAWEIGGLWKGFVNPLGSMTTAWFEYGLDSTLASYYSTSGQLVGSGYDVVGVGDTPPDLMPDTIYYYRIAASSTRGEQKGSIIKVPIGTIDIPVVSTGEVTNVFTSTAVLHGTVDPINHYTYVKFEYGTTPAYGNEITAVESPLDGMGYQSVHAELSGLVPNTLYHYRIVAWNSDASSNGSDEFFKTIGIQLNPQIYSIRDVPNDQGGKAKLCWVRSEPDTNTAVLPYYSIWRSTAPWSGNKQINPAAAAVASGFANPAVRLRTVNGTTYAWEWVANQPAHRLLEYSFACPTLFDSMSTTDGKHYFFISAHTNDPNVFYDSDVDSGYSVDNLAPQPPWNFLAEWTSEGLKLRWDPNSESDLHSYILYRGTQTSDLVQFAVTKANEYIDTDPAGSIFYAVQARDIHENRSEMSRLNITGAADGKGLPTTYRLYQNHPNPFNPATMIRFDLPKETFVSLKVYTVLGQEVRTLVNGKLEAGAHSVSFDASGLSSGVYLYRMQAADYVEVRTLILVR